MFRYYFSGKQHIFTSLTFILHNFGVSPLQVRVCMSRNVSCWSQGHLESWWRTPRTFGLAETSQSLHPQICLLEFSCLQVATYGCHTRRKAGPNLVFWWICWRLSTMQITNLFLSVIKGTLLCDWHAFECLGHHKPSAWSHVSTHRALSLPWDLMKFISLYLDRKATSWSLVLRRHWKNFGRETRKQAKERKSNREFANQANEPQCKWARSTRDSVWVQAHIQSQILPLMPAARFHRLSQCTAWTSVVIFPHTHSFHTFIFFHCRLLLQRKELHTEDKKNNKIFIYHNIKESGIREMACSKEHGSHFWGSNQQLSG